MSTSYRQIRANRVIFSVASLSSLTIAAIAISHFAPLHQETRFDIGHRDLTLVDEAEPLPPLFPLQGTDYVGLACAIAGLCLAASSGLGGGGLLIPIYILLMDFPVKHAISLTSITVLGGAISNNILNANKRHPDHPHRYCIDWDFILLMEPATIAGAMIGAVLNDFFPDITLVVMLLLLLSFTAYTTLKKARTLYKEESQVLQGVTTSGDEDERQDLVKPGQMEYGSVPSGGSSKTTLMTQESSFGAEKQHQLWSDIVKITLLFVVITIINVLKGGPSQGGGPFGLALCGETCFLMTQVLMLLLIFLFVFWCRRNLLARLRGGGPVLSDIAWDAHNTVQYPLLAILAGLVAGLFGVGGGLVKGPLMLALDVHPAVASATSACMILFTSSTATISYVIFGYLMYDYAVACFLLGLVATLFGQTVMTLIMQRYRRHSYIAYSIGLVILVSAIAMTCEAVLAILGERTYRG